jgi:hypothetical protein
MANDTQGANKSINVHTGLMDLLVCLRTRNSPFSPTALWRISGLPR